jgi:hypothetical protein
MTYALTRHDGLLSSELSASIAKIRADFAPWFKVATSLSNPGMRVLPVLKPNKTSDQQLLAAALYGRVLTYFQSTYVLTERGLLGDARAIVSVAVETTVVLSALVQDP